MVIFTVLIVGVAVGIFVIVGLIVGVGETGVLEGLGVRVEVG